MFKRGVIINCVCIHFRGVGVIIRFVYISCVSACCENKHPHRRVAVLLILNRFPSIRFIHSCLKLPDSPDRMMMPNPSFFSGAILCIGVKKMTIILKKIFMILHVMFVSACIKVQNLISRQNRSGKASGEFYSLNKMEIMT